MALDDVANLGGATPAQRDAGAAMSIIVDDEFTRIRLGIEPVRAVAERSDPSDAGSGRIGVKRKVGRWQIGHDKSSKTYSWTALPFTKYLQARG
jgi:hypothetical protein